jgi:hypothetical protein
MTETDCTETEAENKTGRAETKTSRTETGRDQEYVVQSRTDQICIKIIHGIIASSQQTVDGTPLKELNQKLRTSGQQNKNNFFGPTAPH